MMQNLGSNPKISCSVITEAVITIALRYFFQNELSTAFCSTTAAFRFLRINCNTEYPGIAGVETFQFFLAQIFFQNVIRNIDRLLLLYRYV